MSFDDTGRYRRLFAGRRKPKAPRHTASRNVRWLDSLCPLGSNNGQNTQECADLPALFDIFFSPGAGAKTARSPSTSPRCAPISLTSYPQPRTLILALLHVSRIKSNRGPWYPCSVCAKSVGSNSFECSLCTLWVYWRCSGMSRRSDYTGNGVWRCPRFVPAPVATPPPANPQNHPPAYPHHV